MTDAILSPYQLLIDYAWALLEANTGMRRSDYDGLIPIVPLAEAPEVVEYGKPYLVYGYSLDSTNDVYARRTGSMSFAVYSENFRDITRIINVLSEGFGRLDESARDINNFTSRFPHFHGLRFGTVGLGFVEGGSPEETEGGNQSGIINIRFEYYIDYSVNTAV